MQKPQSDAETVMTRSKAWNESGANGSLGLTHWCILLQCFAVFVFDGLDIVLAGYIAPAVISDWHISRRAFGPVLSFGLLGLAIGAVVGGPTADRIGRRKVIIGSVAFFGLMSLASALSPNTLIFGGLRFLTGLGLGASQPNAATLVSEYAPPRYRARMVTAVYCGFTAGAALGGILSSLLIPIAGWPSMLVVGGVLPVAYAVVLYFTLPESPEYLALRQSENRRWRLSALPRDDTTFTAVSPKAPFKRLLEGWARSRKVLARPHTTVTLAMWVGVFMNLLTIYFLNSWMPTMLNDIGLGPGDVALVGTMFQVGGTVGNIAIGWALDRLNSNTVMISVLAMAGACTLMIGKLDFGLYAMVAMVFFLGFCISSANTGWTASATRYYPTEMRATGTSWMIGFGRCGSILGAFIGAILLGMNWKFSELLSALTIPIGIAVIAAWGGTAHAKCSSI
jgi:AAHS family 4-hydroxybenzoate transporter-like MFS transporter